MAEEWTVAAVHLYGGISAEAVIAGGDLDRLKLAGLSLVDASQEFLRSRHCLSDRVAIATT